MESGDSSSRGELQGDGIEEPEETGAEQAHEVNTDFINEKIKARPVNRKRLLRRTVMTACMAVLFGTVACIVFLVLEPLINKAMNPEETQAVTIPEQASDEISPEDMIASDEEKQKAQTEEAVSQAVSQMSVDAEELKSQIREEVRQELSDEMETTTGYESVYSALSEVAKNAQPSMVSVAGITAGTDWAGEAFDNTNKTAGLIVARTQDGILILVSGEKLADAEKIRVTFTDGAEADAAALSKDSVTGLCMLQVPLSELKATTRSDIRAAVFGSSQRIDLLGKPVIAVGSPMGTAGSVAYGVVTNAQLPLDMADSAYQQLTTDIYGSTRAAGVLLDTNGEVIGWTDSAHNAKDTPNLIQAIGITELKPLIEDLSNGKTMGYAGFHGGDVPEDVQEGQGVPAGAYISNVDMDSPAMEAGVQSGDVVTDIGSTQIEDYAGLVKAVAAMEPDRGYSLVIERQAGSGYTEVRLRLSAVDRIIMSE